MMSHARVGYIPHAVDVVTARLRATLSTRGSSVRQHSDTCAPAGATHLERGHTAGARINRSLRAGEQGILYVLLAGALNERVRVKACTCVHVTAAARVMPWTSPRGSLGGNQVSNSAHGRPSPQPHAHATHRRW